jgi:hypothetical protein
MCIGTQLISIAASLEISAEQGKGDLRSADIVQDVNNFHFQGAMELPSDIQRLRPYTNESGNLWSST